MPKVEVFEWVPEGDGYKRTKPFGAMIDGKVLCSPSGNMRAFRTRESAEIHAQIEVETRERNAMGKPKSEEASHG